MNSSTPVHRVRSGHVQAEVWHNGSPPGDRYSVTFGRLYHVGDNWKSYPARTFGPDELQRVAEVAAMASDWITRQSDEARNGGRLATGAVGLSGPSYAEE